MLIDMLLPFLLFCAPLKKINDSTTFGMGMKRGVQLYAKIE